ncbi:unnamed protein product [Rotaria magnacalcarata]|uniref:F-box domain-containing protein n=1 Tax=Rotaria magnacalcarata TaxID=392030 RepID=A0A819DIG5_9BILA|nr:unnamed protein product [Rotaria magnacalcarata]CAF2186432.1 unnamed protein product [Rotaria magnacalcarata]CAF3838094.1 unnamed protein product [Rotaria magnacalcarata]CAF3844309.1 unnamed protein product [Rotaria magnacalcarata]
MHQSTNDILALCDEILLAILNRLNSIDVLYSIIGVNERLDRLARDISFTRSIDLVTILSNEDNPSKTSSILNRFCFDILPRIQHNIECLTLDPLSIDRVLRIGNYPKLDQLTLVNLPPLLMSRIFDDESSIIHRFKNNITHLSVTMNEVSTCDFIQNLVVNVVNTIFIIFTNLTCLHFGLQDACLYSPTLLIDFLPTTRFSSNVVHLNISVCDLDDCLYLLDGRLSQLQTFIVEVYMISKTSMLLNNMETVSKLKCFSLSSFLFTTEYDSQIVPLLHQMSQLENLTLSLLVCDRASFIDGTHLINDIASKMSYLNAFIFNITTTGTTMDEELYPTSDEVSRVLIQAGYNVECYIDCSQLGLGSCHIYSLPFTMERMDTFVDNFPDGVFLTVRHLFVHDLFRPFEHDFFIQISQSCPLLHKLTISNSNAQQKKFMHQQNEHEQTSSIVQFSHLMILDLSMASLDYAEQFLFDFNTHLPCLNTLLINYYILVNATQYFTNNPARATCSKLQRIICEEKPKMYPENFCAYFPLLKKIKASS